MTDQPYIMSFLLRELVSKEGISEEHLADHIDEVDAVRQQHLNKAWMQHSSLPQP